jgi:thioredoxin-like negative regulator of GroEL
MVPRLTDSTFEAAIARPTPILLSFSRPRTCPKCGSQKPILEEMLAMHPGQVFLIDCEQEDTARTCEAFGGKGVPFHRWFAHGRVLLDVLGLSTKQELHEGFVKATNLAQRIDQHGAPQTLSGILAGFGRELY